MGASTAFKAAVRVSIGNIVSSQTLIDLTNQRSAEGGTDPTTISETVLTEAIQLASAEVVEKLGSSVTDDDYLAIKLALERTIQDLAQTYSVNLSQIGIVSKEETEARMEKIRLHRVAAARTVTVTRNGHGYPDSPSGFDPFGGR